VSLDLLVFSDFAFAYCDNRLPGRDLGDLAIAGGNALK